MPPDDDVARHERLRDLNTELARLRVTRRSADGSATAEVDGHGKLLSLAVDDRALRGAHPQLIGTAIVEAVGRARSGAGAEAGARAAAVVRPVDTPAAAAPVAPEEPEGFHGLGTSEDW